MTIGKTLFTGLCAMMLTTGCAMFGGNTSKKATQKNAEQASSQISKAAEVIQRMEADSSIKSHLQNARGVFIVPRYGQAALGIGANLAEGVLLVKNGMNWSDPAFYNIGGLTAGLQAGAEFGSLAFILNNEKAVQQFMNTNNFQLSADAGLTVADWEKKQSVDLSRADMIAWSDVKGLFGGAAVALRDVRFDQPETSAFYGQQNVEISQIFSGQVKADQAKTSILKQALRSGSTRSPSSILDGNTTSVQGKEQSMEEQTSEESTY